MIRKIIVWGVVLMLMLTWIYASVSKLLEYNTAYLQFSQSPFITEFAGILVWAIPALEITISCLLFIDRTRRLGLYFSLGLMTMFSAYIYAMLHMSYHIPCSCGGILNNLGWEEHLVFNLVFVLLTIIAIILSGKTALLRIVMTMLLAIGVVVIVAWGTIHAENKPTGFNRLFLKEPFKLVREWDNPVVVAGIEVYAPGQLLIKTKDPGIIWMVDIKSGESYIDTIPFPRHERATWSYEYIPWDGNIGIAAGNVPAVYFSGAAYKLGNLPFTRIIRISPSSFIARGFDEGVPSKDQVFIKESIQSKERIINDSVFPLLHDAGLSTDGNLLYDHQTSIVNYLPFYTNQLIALDTNLNIVYSKSTIDPYSSNHTKIGSIQEGGDVKYTNTGPKRTINTDNCVSSGVLYNRSLVKADNETGGAFSTNMVLDLYDVSKGEYVGSTYIPYRQGDPPVGFNVIDGVLFVLYKNKLKKYARGF